MSAGTSARKACTLMAPLALILALATGATAQEEAEPAKEKEKEQKRAMTVSLTEVNESGITGKAKFVRAEGAEDPHAHEVTLRLSGADAGTYPAHIHRGTCESGGGVAVALSPITVEEGAEMAAASTVITPDQLAAEEAEGEAPVAIAGETQEYAAGHAPMAHGPLFIQVHLPNGTPAACGDLTHGEKEGAGKGHEGHEGGDGGR